MAGSADAPAGAVGAPIPPDHPAALLLARGGLEEARATIDGCRACDLWQRATQGVFGAGTPAARLMLVGEQPGDREDLAGEPFVGPAGRLLDEALAEAGIDREQAFVTNVVKHFKWRPSGTKRLHDRPSRQQVNACRPWLDLELELVRPELLVLLGATAAQAILGPAFRVTVDHGRILDPAAQGGPRLMATLHPSAVLRARTPEAREEARRMLVADLAAAAEILAEAVPGRPVAGRARSGRGRSPRGARAGHR
ncbi:MAG TPA: UdgX family uracil-DNA binding protein, partial [Clostridia bacterium]|nr:UdgX family uracil-DNA binding protein [Clostridia bacterium]